MVLIIQIESSIYIFSSGPSGPDPAKPNLEKDPESEDQKSEGSKEDITLCWT